MMLCFPTSPIWWFCTTLQNRKPRNCVFSLKHCMLLCQRTHIQIITLSQLNHPSFPNWWTVCIRQLKPT